MFLDTYYLINYNQWRIYEYNFNLMHIGTTTTTKEEITVKIKN